MKTSVEWWNDTKNDQAAMIHWLQRQYVGEMAAVNLLSELLIKFGAEATAEEWDTVFKVMNQEAKHGRWIKQLLDDRGIKPEPMATTDRKYWAQVLPAVNSFAEAMAAGFHAESMRLQRIRAIVEDTTMPKDMHDIQDVFTDILPDEEWHEQVFDRMRQGHELTRYHEKGLEALNLVMV